MSSTITKPISMRLTKRQIQQLKHLPHGITIGVVVRALLDAYLDGKLTWVNTVIFEEAARTERAMDSVKFQPKG